MVADHISAMSATQKRDIIHSHNTYNKALANCIFHYHYVSISTFNNFNMSLFNFT